MNPSKLQNPNELKGRSSATPAGPTGQPQRRISDADWQRLISHPKYSKGLFEAKGFVLPASGAVPPAPPDKEDGR